MKTPIFVFSAGWRSGSTLVQRMITASGEALIWGESGGALDCFADAIERYVQMLGPGGQRYKRGFGGNGAEQFEKFRAKGPDGVHEFIACMNPPEEIICAAFRKMLESLYAMPAIEMGYARWGIKEVQSGIRAAGFLKKLYPDAKFVFLVRNPLDCLLSMKRRNWMDRADINDPLSYFALHWKKLVKGFREAGFGHLIRYEDLVSVETKRQSLFEYLEISKLPSEFVRKSRADWKPMNQKKLGWTERLKAKRIFGDEMARYGYIV